MRLVNVFAVEMEEGPGRDGFWFRAAPLGPMLGAARIGAGLYEAREGAPIWPYHYHYPDEEWLYVLGGAPVLRDVAGRRFLDAGDVVCFAAGHRGAHTLEGPGRFIIFSGERSSGPFVSVDPDSDSLGVPWHRGRRPQRAAPDPRQLGRLLARRGHRGSVPPAAVRREPEGVPRPPRLNARDLTFEPGDGWRWASLGDAAGAERLDGAFLELDPGADFGPYRYDYGRELWLFVLAGTPAVQHAEGGEQALSPADLICLPEGPAGGRSVLNRSGETARVLLLWTSGFPAAICYPKTGEWILRPTRGRDEIRLRRR